MTPGGVSVDDSCCFSDITSVPFAFSEESHIPTESYMVHIGAINERYNVSLRPLCC